jgi:dipeptidyl aminopeptidase/acylaminoacyl peptidase
MNISTFVKSIINSILMVLTINMSISAWAAPSLKDYGALPTTSMIAVSPNGKLVALRKVADGKDIITVFSQEEQKVISGLDIASIQPQQIFFLNDQQLYLFASQNQRVDGFRGKFDTSSGFVFDIKTQEVKQLLIPGQNDVYPGQTGLGNIVGISKDGQSVFIPAYLGKADLILGQNYVPNKGVIKANLKSRVKHKVFNSGSLYSKNFFIGQNDDLLAEERYDERNNMHSLWSNKTGKLKEIFNQETKIRTKDFVGISPDYESLVFIETNPKTNFQDYYLLHLTTGEISLAGFGRDDASVEDTIVDSNRKVYGVRYSGFTPSYKFFDSALNDRMNKILEQFPDQAVWLQDQSPDWKHIVVKVEGSDYPGTYYLFSEGAKPLFLTSSRPGIKSEDLNPIGKVTYISRDGLKIPTLITIPQDKTTAIKNLPAVIYPHGGPRDYDRIEFDFFAQALAAQGYLVIQPQFRGSSGFGANHALAGNGEWGKKMQNDLTDAVKFFSSKGYIDPNKVCILGGSYGGYAALAGGAFTPELYKCVVSINGVSDAKALLQWDRHNSNHYSELVDYMEKQFADDEVENKELAAISPVNHAAQFTAPVLLIHAEDDKRVPYRQSTAMESALEKAKKSVRLVKLKGDNHYLQESETRLQALEETVKFINQHLK